jgi:transposase-like protein
MLAPDAGSVLALSKKLGVCDATLWRWRREAMLAAVSDKPSSSKVSSKPSAIPKRPQDWTLEEKLRLIVEASQLGDDQLGAFLRERGLHEAELEEWRTAAAEALAPGKSRKKSKKSDSKRVRELERQLARKDRALAEAAALLMLKKKAQAIWGDEDDEADGENET